MSREEEEVRDEEEIGDRCNYRDYFRTQKLKHKKNLSNSNSGFRRKKVTLVRICRLIVGG